MLLILIERCLSATISLGVTASPNVIARTATYTFTFSRLNNPLTGAANTNLATLGPSTKIVIQFPAGFGVASATCSAIVTVSCIITGQNLTVSDYFLGASANVFIITVGQVVNPTTTGTYYFFYWLTASSTIIDSGVNSVVNQSPNPVVTIQPGLLSSIITSTPPTVLQNSILTLDLTPSNPIPSSGRVQVILPGSWADDPNASPVCGGTVTVSAGAGVDSTIRVVSFSQQLISPFNFVIVLGNLNANPLSSAFSFSLSPILNPPTVGNTQQVVITSLTSSGQAIDQGRSSVSGLAPGALTSTTLTTNSQAAGSLTYISLSFVPSQAFSITDSIQVQFPPQFTVANPTLAPSSNFDGLQFSLSSNLFTISGISNSVAYIQTLITLQFFQIINPSSTATIPAITVTLLRSGLPYSSGSFSYQVSPGTLSNLLLTPTYSTVGSIGTATLALTPANPLPVGAWVCLQYPSSMAASNQPNTPCGSGTCSTQANKFCIENAVTALRSTAITLSLANFQQPGTVKSQTASIVTLLADGVTVIDSGTVVLQATVGSIAPTASSSESKVYSATTFTLSFTASQPFNSLQVLIPNIVLVSSPNCLKSGLNAICSFLSDTLTLSVSGNTAETLSVSFTATTPISFSPFAFTLTTLFNNFRVETGSSGSLAMTQTQQFSTVSLTRSSSANSNPSTTYTFNIAFPSFRPSAGTVKILFPSGVAASGVTCATGVPAVQISCTFSSNSVSVSVTPLASNSLTLQVLGLTNPPSFQQSGPFSVSYQDSGGFLSLLSSLAGVTNTVASALTLTLAGTGFMAQSNSLTLALSTNALQTKAIIKIPAEFADLPSPLSCSVTCTALTARTFQVSFTTNSITFSLTLTAPSQPSSSPFWASTYSSTGMLVSQGSSGGWTAKCGIICRDCSAGACLNCYSASLAPSNYVLSGTVCGSACPLGRFPQSGNCSPCHSSCMSCQGTATTCTSCSPPLFFMQSSSLCLNNCPDGYYPDSTSKCQVCLSSCFRCSSYSVCTACSSGSFFFSSGCYGSCPSAAYFANSVTHTCDPCTSNCQTCSGSTVSCLSCLNSLLLQGSNCVVSCSADLFPKLGVCSPCQPPCRTCQATTTTCSSCVVSSANSYLKAGQCVSTCTGSNFVDSSNSCLPCPSACTTCSGPNTCLSCQDSLVLSGTNCLASCPISFYDNAKVCSPCSNFCASCVDSASKCTSCPAGYYLQVNSCLTSCLSGFYPNSGVCAPCQVCLACSSLNRCTSCPASLLYYNNYCYSSCPASTYLSSLICINCPSLCFACNSASLCTSCVAPNFLQGALCVAVCATGVGSQGVCHPCGLYCANCQGNTCQACSAGAYLFGSGCLGSCPTGYYGAGSICSPCNSLYPDCSSCTQLACNACTSGILYQGACTTCPQGSFADGAQCSACADGCSSCTSKAACSTCSTSFLLQAGACVTKCSPDRIPSSGQCKPCSQGCSLCSQSTLRCVSCSAGLLLYGGGCVKTCPGNLTASVNGTSCVSILQRILQTPNQVYFPFTITAILLFVVTIAGKLYVPDSLLLSSAAGLLGPLLALAWATSGGLLLAHSVEVTSLGSIPGILLIVAFSLFLVINLGSLLHIYNSLLMEQSLERCRRIHPCAYRALFVLTAIAFQAFRLFRCRFLAFEPFCLALPLSKSLRNLQLLFLSLPALLACAASVLGCYYSPSTSSAFFASLDCLLFTVFEGVLQVLDCSLPSQRAALADNQEGQLMGEPGFQNPDDTLNQLNKTNGNKQFRGYNSVLIQGNRFGYKGNHERCFTEQKSHSLFLTEENGLENLRQHKDLARVLTVKSGEQGHLDDAYVHQYRQKEHEANDELYRKSNFNEYNKDNGFGPDHQNDNAAAGDNLASQVKEQQSPEKDPQCQSPLARKEYDSVELSKIQEHNQNVSQSEIGGLIELVEDKIFNEGRVDVQPEPSKYETSLPLIDEEKDSPLRQDHSSRQQSCAQTLDLREVEPPLITVQKVSVQFGQGSNKLDTIQKIDQSEEDDEEGSQAIDQRESEEHVRSERPFRFLPPAPRSRKSSNLPSRKIQVRSRRSLNKEMQTQTQPLQPREVRERQEEPDSDLQSAESAEDKSLQFMVSPSDFNVMNQRYDEQRELAGVRDKDAMKQRYEEQREQAGARDRSKSRQTGRSIEQEELRKGPDFRPNIIPRSDFPRAQQNPLFEYQDRVSRRQSSSKKKQIEKIYLKRG